MREIIFKANTRESLSVVFYPPDICFSHSFPEINICFMLPVYIYCCFHITMLFGDVFTVWSTRSSSFAGFSGDVTNIISLWCSYSFFISWVSVLYLVHFWGLRYLGIISGLDCGSLVRLKLFVSVDCKFDRYGPKSTYKIKHQTFRGWNGDRGAVVLGLTNGCK